MNDFHDESFVWTPISFGQRHPGSARQPAAGAQLNVTFTLNKEGILEVTGRDLTTNREIHATMQATAGTIMSSEEVACG